jgi:arginine/lysine/ornithine decarboxylase
MVSFAIPAHNGGRGPLPEVAKWAGLDAVRSDVSMSHGVDTRDRAWKVQSTAQELFAEAVGAKQVLFSTNGSSMSVHVAVMTVAGPNDTIVLARNGHKSVFAALVLSGARPVWVDPYYDDELEIALGPLPQTFAAATRSLATPSSPKARSPRAPTWRSDRCTRRSLAWGRPRSSRSARTASTVLIETVESRDATGRVSAELITPYPPGIPAIAPGELINAPLVEYLDEIVANGAFLEGAADPTVSSFRVVSE